MNETPEAPAPAEAPELIAANVQPEVVKFAKVTAGYDTDDNQYAKRDEITEDSEMFGLMKGAYKAGGKKDVGLVVEYWSAADEADMDLLGTDHVKNMEILEGTGPGGLFRGAQGPAEQLSLIHI